MAISRVVPVTAGGGGAAPQQSVMSSAYRAPPIQPRYSSGAQDFTKGFTQFLPYLMKAMDRKRVKKENIQLAETLMQSGVGGLGIDDSKQYMTNEIDQKVPDLYTGPGKSGSQFVTNLTPNAPTEQDPQQRQIYQMLQAGAKSGNKNMIDAAMRMSQTYKTQKAEESRFQRRQKAEDKRWEYRHDVTRQDVKDDQFYAKNEYYERLRYGWTHEQSIRQTKQQRADRLKIDQWGREDKIRAETRRKDIEYDDLKFQRDKAEYTTRLRKRNEYLEAAVDKSNDRADRIARTARGKWESNRQKMHNNKWYTTSELRTLFKNESGMWDAIDISMAPNQRIADQMVKQNKKAQIGYNDWLIEKMTGRKPEGKPTKPWSEMNKEEFGALYNKNP